MRPQRVNGPAWLRGADKVVQLNELQARHHLPNRMARLDTSDGDDNTTTGQAHEVFGANDQSVMNTVPKTARMQLDDM